MKESGYDNSGSTLWDVLQLQEYFAYLIKHKKIILIVSIFSAALFLCMTFVINKTYLVRVVLSPVSSSQSGGLEQVASRFSGLASLAGISLQSDGPGKSEIALEMLNSPRFIYNFLKDNDLLIPLFAGKKWDSEKQELVLDSKVYDQEKSQWMKTSMFGLRVTEGKSPTPNAAYSKFRGLLSINPDDRKGFVYLEIEYISPELGAEWITLLVDYLNSEYRKKEEDKIKKNIEFLNKKAAETNLSELKNVFYRLIEEQTKMLLLTNSNDEYIFSVVSKPLPPDPQDEYYPSKVVFLVCGLFVGFFASISFLILRARSAIRG